MSRFLWFSVYVVNNSIVKFVST